MTKYILKGCTVAWDEEYMQQVFQYYSNCTFNERDFKAWMFDLLKAGEIKFAE